MVENAKVHSSEIFQYCGTWEVHTKHFRCVFLLTANVPSSERFLVGSIFLEEGFAGYVHFCRICKPVCQIYVKLVNADVFHTKALLSRYMYSVSQKKRNPRKETQTKGY